MPKKRSRRHYIIGRIKQTNMRDILIPVYKVKMKDERVEELSDGSLRNYYAFKEDIVGEDGVESIIVDPYHGVIQIEKDDETIIIKRDDFIAWQKN